MPKKVVHHLLATCCWAECQNFYLDDYINYIHPSSLSSEMVCRTKRNKFRPNMQTAALKQHLLNCVPKTDCTISALINLMSCPEPYVSWLGQKKSKGQHEKKLQPKFFSHLATRWKYLAMRLLFLDCMTYKMKPLHWSFTRMVKCLLTGYNIPGVLDLQ